ncbi:MAG: hypothetical protein EAX90_09740 [Candidatus Heimdallarchaeota archaeon]|nr:hypothetical protein [Candidatus Heimdallarchaeota archaeon]
MNLPNLWPKELQTYYWRLDDNFRKLVISYIEKNRQSKLDVLKNFIAGMNQMLENNGIYMSNSEFLYLATATLQIQGKYSEVLKICQKDEMHPGLLNANAFSLISQKKFENILDIIEKAKNFAMDTDPVNYILALANELLYYYYTQMMDKIPIKLEFLENEYRRLLENIINNELMQIALLEAYILGRSVEISSNRRSGKLEEGAKIGISLIEQARKTENRYLLNRLLNNTAICLIEKGNLKEGLNLLEEHFKFSEIISNELQLAIGANNIGFIYRTMGNLEMAMKYFFIALENSKLAKVAPYIIATETNIAHLHLDFGNPKSALSDSEIAVESLKKSEVPVPTSIKVALNLCRADIFENLDRFDDATTTLEHAIELIGEENLTTEFPKIYLRQARLAARQSNLGEATNLLNKTYSIAFENNLFEIIVNAKLQLAEIDLLKYRMTNENVLLFNALDKIGDSKQLCIEQDFKLILIDILILEGLLLSLNNKKKEGKKILHEAIEIANELNLSDKEIEAKNQLQEIEKEKKNLLVRIFTRINESIRSSISFESVSKPKDIKTELKALYIISKSTGLPIFQKEFETVKSIDSNLLSGLLSAIRSMGEEILAAEEGGLKLIDHGNVAIMLETGTKSFISLVVSQETFILREKLRQFTERFNAELSFEGFDSGVIFSDQKRNEAIEKLFKEIFQIL